MIASVPRNQSRSPCSGADQTAASSAAGGADDITKDVRDLVAAIGGAKRLQERDRRRAYRLLACVLVGLGVSSEHALDLISEIIREASCPVIALLSVNDPAYIREAAKRGVFAYIVDGRPDELQSAIDITLQRFSEYQSLQGAFGRRATIEQAKGILMARHSINADKAFEMLRDHSQHNGRKLVDVAEAVVESHLLLLPPTPNPTEEAPSTTQR